MPCWREKHSSAFGAEGRTQGPLLLVQGSIAELLTYARVEFQLTKHQLHLAPTFLRSLSCVTVYKIQSENQVLWRNGSSRIAEECWNGLDVNRCGGLGRRTSKGKEENKNKQTYNYCFCFVQGTTVGRLLFLWPWIKGLSGAGNSGVFQKP